MRRSSLSWKRSCRKLHSLHSSEAMWGGQPRFLCDCPPFLSAISIPEPGPLRKWRRCPRPDERPSESFDGNLLRSHHRWQWQNPSLRAVFSRQIGFLKGSDSLPRRPLFGRSEARTTWCTVISLTSTLSRRWRGLLKVSSL